MDVSWLLLVVSAAVFVSIVLLAIVCLDCWKKGPLVSIRQTNPSDEYIPPTQFRVLHPSHSAADMNAFRPAPHLLSPNRAGPASGDPQRRHPSFTPTETESNPSYENPAEEPGYMNPDPNHPDSDIEDTGYITVIPDGEAPAASAHSRASTPSSDVQHDYENISNKEGEEDEETEEDEEQDEERDYLNVDPKLSQTQSDTDDDDDDDDYDASYVNQPAMVQSAQSLINM